MDRIWTNILEADDGCWLARHMLETFAVALIEPDARRRAHISFASSQAGVHLEPYESAHELQVLADKRAVLVHDDGQQLAETLDRCDRAGHWIPIVAYSEQPTSTRVAEAIFAGALDYLALPFSPADLSLSLERVRERADVVGKRREDAVKARTRLENLSAREHEVVTGMAQGLTNKAIARRLQISPRTVEIHRANAIGKLGVETSSEALMLAFAATQGDR